MTQNDLTFEPDIAKLPKVIALDLDGTLLTSDKTVSPRNLTAVKQCIAKGFIPIIATARPPRTIKKFLTDDLPPILSICFNGAEVYEDGKRIIQHGINPDTAKKVVRLLEKADPEATISIEMDDVLYTNKPLDTGWPHQVADLIQTINRPIAKILFNNAHPERIKAIHESLPCECHLLTFDDGYGSLADIVAPGVNKASTLKEVLAGMELSMADVIAFGDDSIDIDMRYESGIGVAMANALPEVQTAADHITLSNDEDGVAVVLEQLLRVQGSEVEGQ